jgi:hypothetical protein
VLMIGWADGGWTIAREKMFHGDRGRNTSVAVATVYVPEIFSSRPSHQPYGSRSNEVEAPPMVNAFASTLRG